MYYFRADAYGRTGMSEESDHSAPHRSTGAWQQSEVEGFVESEEESDGKDTSSMDSLDLKVGRRRSDSDPVVDSEQGESSDGSTGGLELGAGEPDVPEGDNATLQSSPEEEGSSEMPAVDDTTHAVETRQRLQDELDPAHPSSPVDSSDIACPNSKSDAGCRWRVNDLKKPMSMADTLGRSGNGRGPHDPEIQADDLTSVAFSHGPSTSATLGPQQKKRRRRKPKFPSHTRLR
ncbi:hypothetical protein JCM24511_04326 [Saitozyma sp. JCM 24511]|nr:hypothetical protein JCM24511_04326 [Saitozyma sp. JCM 24511]